MDGPKPDKVEFRTWREGDEIHSFRKLTNDLLFGWFEVVAELAELKKVCKCIENTNHF